MAQAQHVARNVRPGRAVLGGFPLHVLHHRQFHLFTRQGAVHTTLFAVVERVPAGQPPGVVVRLAAHHHAVQVLQLFLHRLVGGEAAVDGKGELRKVGLQLAHHLVAQGRNIAVFLRAQALQPGIARVHDEHGAACIRHGAHEVAHKAVAFFLVDANAVLHRHGHVHHVAHGFHAVGHQLRRLHQAGAKGSALHAVAGAAAVEVDFVIAPLGAQPCGLGQVGGLAAAQLQGHRVLFGIEAQVALCAPVDDGACVHHFGVQQGVPGQQAVKVAAMAVGPVHHRGDGHAPWACGGGHGVYRVRKRVGGASGGHGPAALRGWDYPIGVLTASCGGLAHRAAWGDGPSSI